jgi:hypothetical protein
MNDRLEEFELVQPSRFRARISQSHVLPAESVMQRVMSDIPGITAEELFTFSGEISNQSVDSWDTCMAESSLKNYAEDAQTGVAFMNSHKHGTLPVGYSVAGQYVAGDNPSVLADFYTVRNLDMSGMNTDSFIKGVNANLVRDLSIGFKEGPGFLYSCNICGLSMWDWDCRHIPGMEYDVVTNPEADPSMQVTTQVLCFAWVENARLSEVSAVFDGATPGAMIVKATREQRAGRLKPDVQRMLESAYRIHLPKPRIITVGEINQSKENDMANKEQSGAPDNEMRAGIIIEPHDTILAQTLRLEARTAGVEVADTDTPEAVAKAMRTEIARLRPFEALANDGRVLRSALIDESLNEGVRAYGNDFNREAKQAMLEAMPIDMVRELRDSWRDVAGKLLTPGRKSVDNPEESEAERKPVTHIPEAASAGV